MFEIRMFKLKFKTGCHEKFYKNFCGGILISIFVKLINNTKKNIFIRITVLFSLKWLFFINFFEKFYFNFV